MMRQVRPKANTSVAVTVAAKQLERQSQTLILRNQNQISLTGPPRHFFFIKTREAQNAAYRRQRSIGPTSNNNYNTK